MSSTFAHYQQPASLPSDYAILSRYAGHHPDGEGQDDIDSDDGDTETEDTSERATSSSLLRRSSLPASHHRPQNPNMIPTHSQHFKHIPVPGPIPSENTPLLNPPVPRIDEPLEQTPGNGSVMKVFWEELRILTRYALPVFGCVLRSCVPGNTEREPFTEPIF
jgi:MATE family multidrug resistance protein